MCSDISGCLICQQGDEFFDQASKGWGIGLFVAQNRQFVIDEWVIGNMYFHGSYLTGVSFLSNE
jgi:hypothetical protein